jgi:hypothetical protein
MRKVVQTGLIGLLGAVSAFCSIVQVPEISAGTATAAIALLSGGVLILRSRRRK